MTASASGLAPAGLAGRTIAVTSIAVLLTASVAVAIRIDAVLVLTGILAIVGAALVILDPDRGLLAIAAFSVLRLPDVATDFHGAPSLFQPLAALVVLAVALRWAHTGARPPGGLRAGLAGGTLILVALTSIALAPDATGSQPDLELLIKDVAVAALAGVLLGSVAVLRRLMWVLVTGGALLGLISVFQTLTGSFDNEFLGFGQSAVQNIVGASDDVRISGPIGDPNFYAQWMVVLLPLAIDRMRAEQMRPLRWLAGGAAVLAAMTIVFTFSRGGAVALGVVLLAMTVRHPPRLRTVAMVGVVTVVALPLLPGDYSARLGTLTQVGEVESDTDISIRIRTSEIGAGFAMFGDSPIIGLGYGTFIDNYPAYARPIGIDLSTKGREAHNLFVETAAETGVVGLTALAGLFGAALASLAGGRRRLRRIGLFDGDDTGYAIAVGIFGYLVTSLFLHMAFARLIWLILGIAFAFPSMARAEARRRAARSERAWQ